MKELPKAYNAQEVEDRIYQEWEESGFFSPDVCVQKNICKKDSEVFSLLMPPPNVTGVLHLGHALENTIMDIAVRFNRLQGKRCLFLPGTDHSAVATQARVERNLIEEGKCKNPREELGREKLLAIIRQYAENSKSTILHQIRKMGSSCDWSRLAYTFDDERSKAVNTVFKKMFDDGLIYRGYRVVNWSVKGQSTCSDDELVYEERKAKLYTFKYAKDFPISIATTRPETKLGDTAVAVNPKDDRYKKYLGQVFTVDVGSLNHLKIKIIASEEVDPAFGTGALGVTPAHSQIDYAIYEKQKALGDPIDLISVIDQLGKMTKETGEKYQGLSVEEAREKFVQYLRENNLLEKEEEVLQNVGTSDRFKDPIEVIPMEQWFVDVNKKIPVKDKSLKDLMKEAVTVGHNNDENQKIEIIPERFRDSYLSWIDNLRDWCISRQIWWGHRIPVWTKEGQVYVGTEAPKESGWEQDPDTLDTWFSSGLWSFSTLGWPEPNFDLKDFYPNTWMQMGYEILFFWMARMILMSTYTMDQIPFRHVYIHGMLRNEAGKKFSKSDKTGVDPVEMINLYGADALRLSLIMGNSPGNDGKFTADKIENAKNFVNKFWNIARFILAKAENKKEDNNYSFTLADQWFFSRLNQTKKEVSVLLEKWDFSLAYEKVRDFVWHELADWYLEIAKIEAGKETILVEVLLDLLKLIHPFAPFITEDIYQKSRGIFRGELRPFLMVESWPIVEPDKINPVEEQKFDVIKNVISAIRNLRAENKIEPKEEIKIDLYTVEHHDLLEANKHLIKKMARLADINFKIGRGDLEENAVGVVVFGCEIYIPYSQLKKKSIDIKQLAQEKNKIEADILQTEQYLKTLKVNLANQDFLAKAPKPVIVSTEKKLADASDKLKKLQDLLDSLAD